MELDINDSAFQDCTKRAVKEIIQGCIKKFQD